MMAWLSDLWDEFKHAWLPLIIVLTFAAAGAFVVFTFTAALLVWSFRTLGLMPS